MGMPGAEIPRWLALALVAGAMAACGQPGDSPAGHAQAPIAPASDAELFAQRCHDCHVPPRPQDFPAADWPGIVQRMQSHRIATGMDPLTQDEMTRIQSYLQRNARDSK